MRWAWAVLLIAVVDCGGQRADSPPGGDGGASSTLSAANGAGVVGSGGAFASSGGGSGVLSCAEAATKRTYVGCDFWPTVTYNPVYEVFDFAVVVANGGAEEAALVVSRGDAEVTTATVAPGGLEVITLPWVAELKGGAFGSDTSFGRVKESIRVVDGAYHLTSSVPVAAWQFSPLQYKTDIAVCPGVPPAGATDCLSVSNDASLLLPSTAMTGIYRVFGRSEAQTGDQWGGTAGGVAITATADDTDVTVKLAAGCNNNPNNPNAGNCVAAGAGVNATASGGTLTFEMGAGDVVQLLGDWGVSWDAPHADLSGSLVNANRPVQVLSMSPLAYVPKGVAGQGYADHLEETVLPAEVLGTEYVVAPPSGPDGTNVGHLVRLYGNFDQTTFNYPDGKPAGAPDTLQAGDVAEIETKQPFRVTANESFAVGSFMYGGEVQDPDAPSNGQRRGDPSVSMLVTPGQFRTRYTFLAPRSYLASYADILVPVDTSVSLDGQALNSSAEDIGIAGWRLHRELLGEGNDGAHHLEADKPVGVQVMGYGHATSYYYPGGLNLELISEPPVLK